jgi:hypothetical protein
MPERPALQPRQSEPVTCGDCQRWIERCECESTISRPPLPYKGMNVKLTLTKPQAEALMSAVNLYLDAADYEEQVAVFGSPQGIRAAERAQNALAAAIYKPKRRRENTLAVYDLPC